MPDAKITPALHKLRSLLVLLVILFANSQLTDAQDTPKSSQQKTAKKQPTVASVPLQADANGDQNATLEADQQSQVGGISHADGNVDLRYQNTRLRADHVEYNDDTKVAIARGHVQLDYMTQHVEADEAHYEMRTGHGTFFHVRATFSIDRHPTPTLLVSP